ncbi:heavy metal translocating P-type ATPase [Rhodoblastus acidophilus]|uniref:Heavy metal translocating P-type ATPase n=1 Tax=Candidatus Rhodoblastus alkanivorans TaxID=2954117 RepID=A0ABS9ZAT5_9HYPH|nr:heavy metal translocating P-type ATPase [Candidatus Rhodoblastus alkanivorans]MCI4677815.1 heavy metal translocating P-type ATPase [Candidatus Rhodoblastus alkanivorans]MCI4684687.1 heavy metal translocating P-type ATPase [Candidatus Rhodoblastus alkanivorans]MDI4642009.1 heavy metal translocating P-type ATPase [Rhodoblastus acidophilus]
MAAPDYSHFVKTDADGRSRIDLAIDGITCAACLGDIETAMKRLPGVMTARLNLTSHRLAVTFDAATTEAGALTSALEAIGYRAYPFEQRKVEADEAARFHLLLKCLGVAVFAAMNIMLLSISIWSGEGASMSPETLDFFHFISALIALPAAAYAGQPFYVSAWTSLRQGRLNMDVPVTIGVFLALALSVYETQHHAQHAYFDSAIMLLAFLLAGRVMDQAMRRKTRAAAGNLAALKGENALRFAPGAGDDEDHLALTPVAALTEGDRVLIRAGERVPADGAIERGASSVDESAITGETLGKPVKVGDNIYAGSINGDGALILRVTAAGHAALIDEAARLIDAASAARSGYVRLADRVSQLYAPVVHIAALGTGLAWWLLLGASVHDALVIGISVLIITCPCALALAVPAVQAMASGAFFRAGLFLNDATGLEKLGEVNSIVFDKTGTLTLPEPRVANAGEIAPDLLELAGRLAHSSSHPLALALARSARAAAPLPDARETPGMGVAAPFGGGEARLGSAAFCDVEQPAGEADASAIFIRAGERWARLLIRQTLRPDAAKVLSYLRDSGLNIAMLSGDRPEAAAPIARELKIESWRGGLKPADKIAFIQDWTARGAKVLMVGDGLNDAPALAAAYASISPIDAVHLTQTQADAVFLGERLAPVAAAIAIARRARGLMRQNLAFAIGYNLLAVPVAMSGHATPLFAALAMSASSIVVTLNALRLRGPGKGVTLLLREAKGSAGDPARRANVHQPAAAP